MPPPLRFNLPNKSLKATILQEPRPGFRGACIKAYTALYRALDALMEDDPGLHHLSLLEARDWLEEAKMWDQIEVVPLWCAKKVDLVVNIDHAYAQP